METNVIKNDIDLGFIYGYGKPWEQQYPFNDKENKELKFEYNSNFIPDGTIYSQVIVANNKAYLIGGYIGSTDSSTSNIYVSNIDSKGKLGEWKHYSNLPKSVSFSQALLIKDKVYLFGGSSIKQYSSIVYMATVDKNGDLGNWTVVSKLPIPLVCTKAILIRNKVYLLGGENSKGLSDKVYSAEVKEDGSLGTWKLACKLPEPLTDLKAIVTKNRLYILGGMGNNDLSDKVYVASIYEEELFGVWSNSFNLPEPLSHFQVIVTKEHAYLIGGRTNNGFSNKVYRATISPFGVLGLFEVKGSLPNCLTDSQVLITKEYVYLLGGIVEDKHIIANAYIAPFKGGKNNYLNL